MPDKSEDFGSFFQKTMKLEELTASDREILDLHMGSKKGFSAPEFDAYIVFGEPCGHAYSGKKVFVLNKLKNQSLKVTVEVASKYFGQPPKTTQYTKVIAAGGKVFLSCTKTDWIPATTYKYTVIGTEVQ